MCAAPLPVAGVLSLLAGGALAAESSASDNASDNGASPIPALGSDALGSLWPTIAPHLPHAIAGAAMSADGGGRDDHALATSAWAGYLAHPSARMSWGVGALIADDEVDEGAGIPRSWHSMRVVGGMWRRFGLDDHLLIIAAPGISWSTRCG